MARVSAAALLIALLAPSTTACASLIDFFGPRPDPTLVQLAAAELQAGHAQQAERLFAEVSRLCGLQANATVPHSCEVDRNAAVAALASHPAPALLEAGVPQQSRPLVVDIAVAAAVATYTAAHQEAEKSHTPLPYPELPAKIEKEDQEAATALLEWEYELIWALDFARAFSARTAEPRIDYLITQHERLATQLAAQLSNPPLPAAGYQPAGLALPTDAPSAAAFISDLLARTAQRYQQAASETRVEKVSSTSNDGPAPAKKPWPAWLVDTAAWIKTS